MSRRISAAVVSLALAGSAAFVPNAVAAPTNAPVILAQEVTVPEDAIAVSVDTDNPQAGAPTLEMPEDVTINALTPVENNGKHRVDINPDGKNITVYLSDDPELKDTKTTSLWTITLTNGDVINLAIYADHTEQPKKVPTCGDPIDIAPGGTASGELADLTAADTPQFGPAARKDGTNFDPTAEGWELKAEDKTITVTAPAEALPGDVISVVTEADRDCLLFKVPGEENSILAALGIGAAAAAILAALGSGSAGSSTGAPAAPADPAAPAPAPAGPQKGIDPKAAKPAAEGTTQPTATQKGKLANTGTETVLATLAGGVLFAALGAMLIAGRRRSF
ncbi:LPXTG cell wall anchor domain-containing protein [Corynebacterium spheniscorum]|uniref:LPXTG-motif cell wall anchor domain-containing protein n=1 Tax=Corynebacterium spheniscorum TaxID=185761 RepID=A0A1I2UMD9_9CORY|nr:LPXTG cell wall anchor domain-containing protein [Corynebacterium spheniscorum]SFG76026.1 LPXTG-motif cell wall anchor domain-containing protein [Corynebacterium spheniscorum]